MFAFRANIEGRCEGCGAGEFIRARKLVLQWGAVETACVVQRLAVIKTWAALICHDIASIASSDWVFNCISGRSKQLSRQIGRNVIVGLVMQRLNYVVCVLVRVYPVQKRRSDVIVKHGLLMLIKVLCNKRIFWVTNSYRCVAFTLIAASLHYRTCSNFNHVSVRILFEPNLVRI